MNILAGSVRGGALNPELARKYKYYGKGKKIGIIYDNLSPRYWKYTQYPSSLIHQSTASKSPPSVQ